MQLGIIITASHNPAKYNGYKCYSHEGYQMTDAEANATYECIRKVDIFDDVRTMDFDEGIKSGKIEFIDSSVNEAFYECVLSRRVNPDAVSKGKLKLIYTPSTARAISLSAKYSSARASTMLR